MKFFILAILLFTLISCGDNKQKSPRYTSSAAETTPELTENELQDLISQHSDRLAKFNVEMYELDALPLKQQEIYLKGAAAAIEKLPLKMRETLEAYGLKTYILGVKIIEHPDNYDLKDDYIETTGQPYTELSGLTRGNIVYLDASIGGGTYVTLHEWAHVYENYFYERNNVFLSDLPDYIEIHDLRKRKESEHTKKRRESFADSMAFFLMGDNYLNESEIWYFQNLFPDHKVK